MHSAAPEDPFSVPLGNVKLTNTVGYESQYVAAQESIRGFAELPKSVPKTFIFTGNALNQIPLPQVFPFAVSKRASDLESPDLPFLRAGTRFSMSAY